MLLNNYFCVFFFTKYPKIYNFHFFFSLFFLLGYIIYTCITCPKTPNKSLIYYEKNPNVLRIQRKAHETGRTTKRHHWCMCRTYNFIKYNSRILYTFACSQFLFLFLNGRWIRKQEHCLKKQ